MHKRLIELRKHLHFTQQEFANRLNVSRSTIATYEIGKSNPSDAAVSLICREFNVREDWLRNGEGEMFLPVTEDEYIKTAASFSDDPLIRNFVIKYSKLDAVGKKLLYDFLLDLTDSMREQK